MAKKTRLEELQDYAREVGVTVRTYSPGDGVTRYRFFDKPGPGQTYFGPASGMYTALGLKDAWNYLYGYGAGGSRQSHARKKKLTHEEAKRLLESEGVDFSRDYHEGVSMSTGNRIAEVAKMAGYRKRKDAPGSTGRMYYQYLRRLGGASSSHATKRVPKTRPIWIVQGNYGYGQGWEDVTAEEDRKEARDRIREYRENERGVPFRLIRRREKIAA
jgi:hypothetical protein